MPGFCGLYKPTRFPAIWRDADFIEAVDGVLVCASQIPGETSHTRILRIKCDRGNLVRNCRSNCEQSRKIQHIDVKINSDDNECSKRRDDTREY